MVVAWAPDYVTASGVKSYLHIDDAADDVFIGLWATTVSRNVDDFCHRQFGQVDAVEERVYHPIYDRRLGVWVAEIDDLMDDTDLAVVANGTAVTDYTLVPDNNVVKGKPYERILTGVCGPLLITARWGWTGMPAAVPVGAYLQAARLAARRDSPFGISGSPQEQGEIRLLAQLDPDFRTSLKPLVRNWWAA